MATNDPRDPASYLPLPWAHFCVLVALLDSPKHGHAIKVDLALRTGGAVVLGPGTLYPALNRMVEGGLIEEVDLDRPREPDRRRRYYRILPLGERVSALDAARMKRLVGIAESKGLPAD